MHRGHGYRPKSFAVGRTRRITDLSQVQGRNDVAFSVQSLFNFDHLVVEQFGQHDVEIEQLWTDLVADPEQIPQTLGDQENGAIPLRPSSALVATAVPIFTASIAPPGIGASAASPNKSRIP